jgi:putative transposase
MNLTERLLVKPNNENYKQIKQACLFSKSLYNEATYLFRKSFFDEELLTWKQVDKILKHRSKNYNALPAASAQALLRQMGDNWKSFWEANKDWKINPQKYKSRPKIASYSKKLKTFLHPFQSMKCKDGEVIFPKKMNMRNVKIRNGENQIIQEKEARLKQVRFVPHGHCFWIEVIYDNDISMKHEPIKKKDTKLNSDNVLGIDLGINNLLTMVTNIDALPPLLYKGKVIKSINQRFNKSKSYYQSKGNAAMIEKLSIKRFCQINDFFHKASNFVINYCLENDIGRIVIGKNNGWKQDINIGKVNNQKFVFIPFEKLISQIEYKAKLVNIQVDINEESYTSKSDSLALDILPVYRKNSSEKYKFLGRRVKRGLYKSSIGKIINADVNGAINILRKVIGDDFVKNLTNKGFVFNPETISLK